MCATWSVSRIVHVAVFCTSCSFKTHFNSGPRVSALYSNWKVTRVWVTACKASRFRKGHKRHTTYSYLKALLVMAATCSFSRSLSLGESLDFTPGLPEVGQPHLKLRINSQILRLLEPTSTPFHQSSVWSLFPPSKSLQLPGNARRQLQHHLDRQGCRYKVGIISILMILHTMMLDELTQIFHTDVKKGQRLLCPMCTTKEWPWIGSLTLYYHQLRLKWHKTGPTEKPQLLSWPKKIPRLMLLKVVKR